jgi:predicted ABC-type ATPase
MNFRDFLEEQKENHAVLAFGRMNPITSGHEKLVNKVKDISTKVGGSHHIVLSHSQDSKKNPLSATQKVKHAKRAFPGTNFSASSKESPNFLTQAADLHKKGVTHLHVVGGSDRVKEFHDTLHRYNGTHKGALFNFKKITVHSAGERDPDAEGVSGMSASKMRDHASNGKFDEFKKGAPSSMSHEHVKHMYNDVRKGMGIKEDVDLDFEELLIEGVHDKGIFKAVFLAGGPGSGKDYVLSNTLDGHGLVEINSDKALEFLMDKKGLNKRMPESEKEARNLVRGRAKNITELKQRLALQGRNGLIINGTGDDAKKIARIKSALENLGYETSMILVNTSDEVSAERNIERGQRGGRTVPETVRKEKWDSVQNARTEYAKMFSDRYMEFDNSEDLRQAAPDVVKQKKMEMMQLFKNVQDFVAQEPKSEEAEEWIANELQGKDTLKVPKNGVEQVPPHTSSAAQEARQLGLQYYGFGRYGRNGKVLYRSVNDRLVKVTDKEAEQPKVPTTGSSMRKEDIDQEFEELFSEDLRKWFDKDHPEGGWKRINSKGEAIGPCAREPGEPKPKCMSNEKRASLSKKERASAVAVKRKHDPNPERKGKPINVSNFGKGKLSESYQLSDSGSLNLLLLGNSIDEPEFQKFEEQKEEKLLKDKTGKVRVFMLRAAAAREAHTINGTVLKYKNGYVIKLNEEIENDQIYQGTIRNWIAENRRETSIGWSNQSIRGESASLLTESGTGEIPTINEEITKGDTSAGEKATTKITLAEIRQRKEVLQKEEQFNDRSENTTINEIDRGIEPGISMAGAGESIGRDMGEKIKKRSHKVSVTELTGDETTASISAQKEDELKKVGISLNRFKSKRPIG